MAVITYFELIHQAMRLDREGRLSEAYDLLTENGEKVVGNPAQILNFRYCIASKLGNKELAFKLMREAIIDRGYWYGYDYLFEDDDLKPLRDSPEFQSLAEICRGREVEAKKNCKPSLNIIKTESYNSKHPKLLMALHGNGDSAALIEGNWLPCLRQGYSLAFPQSSQITFWEGHTWADLDKGRTELSQHLSSVRSEIAVEPKDLILAGFSGGARLALLSVMRGDVTPGVLILMAPWLPELDRWEEEIRYIGRKGIRFWVLCGDQDRDCLESSKKLSSILEEAGANVHQDIIQNLDHDFPLDFEERLSKTLKEFQDTFSSGGERRSQEGC
jgi:predicted esterase